jgi:hypothetical protein
MKSSIIKDHIDDVINTLHKNPISHMPDIQETSKWGSRDHLRFKDLQKHAHEKQTYADSSMSYKCNTLMAATALATACARRPPCPLGIRASCLKGP